MLRKCLPFILAVTLLLPGSSALAAPAKKPAAVAPKKPAAKAAVAENSEAKLAAPKIDYARQIAPILSKNCFACHGVDEKARKAKLRLDVRDAALAAQSFVPGKPDESELLKRLISQDAEEVMPPPEKGERLSEHDISLVRQWIAEGAEYAPHWAFQSLKPVTVPALPALPEEKAAKSGTKSSKTAKRTEPAKPDPWAGWRTGEIDRFIGAMMLEQGMKPAGQASREEWLRRVTYDLSGLPPTLEELDGFLQDKSPDARERAVDRLLASPAYGEHMAVHWLDAARYGDTYGRHEDEDCTTWPWRDWVIRAFQENLSYNKFILWQTAGDLLPEPTKDMLIATCFNRLPQQSNEAGSNAEEFRIEQVADRVHTNGMVWMGLSMECARCHDHKYDPVSMKDYYGMAAMFNNIDELGLFTVYTGAAPPPVLRLYDPAEEKELAAAKETEQKVLAQKETVLSGARERFAAWLATSPAAAAGQFPLKPVAHLPLDSYSKQLTPDAAAPEKPATSKTKLLMEPGKIGNAVRPEKENVVSIQSVAEVTRADPFSMGVWIKPETSVRRATIIHRSRSGVDAASRGIEVIIQKDHLEFGLVWFSPGDEARLRAKSPVALNEWSHVFVTHDGSGKTAGMKLYVNGQPAEVEVVRDCLEGEIIYRDEWGDSAGKDAVDVTFALMGRHNDAPFTQGLLDDFQYFAEELTAAEVRQIALQDSKPTQEELFAHYCRTVDAPYRAWLEELHAAREAVAAMPAKADQLMIMKEWTGTPRPTHILAKGQFDAPQAPVTAGTPEFLPPMPPGATKNRLGYGQWLISREHPLTSRVAVNRFWQLFFGRGIVNTPEDFGTQGQLPSHADLLDWLAQDFMDSGWDVKKLVRKIVLSAAYRQAARPADPAYLEKDPDNQWMARGPRHRLSGEALRDSLLAVSGLLNRTIGGPSVKPYQPAGLWEDGGTQHTYEQDTGDKLYRRSLYTFWRRTMPPPSMSAFDSPTREFCKVRRTPTATPAQALVLMNDPQFLEAGRILAENIIRAEPAEPRERAKKIWRILTSREATDKQLAVLLASYAKDHIRFQADKAAAETLLKTTGEKPRDPALPAEDVAATTMLVRLILGTLEATSNS